MQKPNTYRMETKECTKCKKTLPNNEEHFHLDKRKVKLGHNIVLAAACKVCKNAQKRITEAKRREKQRKEYGSTYKYKLANQDDFLKKHKKRQLKYKDKIYERNRNYRKLKKDYILKADEERKIKNRKEVEEITDYYVARLIYRNDKSQPIKEILKNKEFIELYRLNLKLKRLCLQ